MNKGTRTKAFAIRMLLTSLALMVALMAPLALAACGGTANEGSQKVTVTVDISAAVQANNSTAKALATAKGGNTYSVTVSVGDNATALDATKAAGFNVVTATASFGTYVTSIDGLASGAVTAEAGWTFLVNGEMPMTGADTTPIKAGDVITWQYVTSFS